MNYESGLSLEKQYFSFLCVWERFINRILSPISNYNNVCVESL